MKTLRRTFGILCLISFVMIFISFFSLLNSFGAFWLLFLFNSVVSTILFYILYVIAFAFRYHQFLILKPDTNYEKYPK